MNFHLNKSWISELLIAITISIVLVFIINNAQAQEKFTITGNVSFQYDGDIYIRVCTLEEWAEFLKPNYELSVPPWMMIKINSET